MTKKCTRCGIVKPASEDHYSPGQNATGFRQPCKPCRRLQYLEKREELLPQFRARYAKLSADPQWAEAKRARQARERAEQGEAIREYMRGWRAKNPTKMSAYGLAWRERHGDNYRAKHRSTQGTRRARKNNAPGTPTLTVVDLHSRQKGRCWWCCKRVRLDQSDIDHRIPLTRGGANDDENLVLSCQTCNRSKGAKMPWEWRGRLL